MKLSNFAKKGKYLMLALDHRGSFKKYVNKNNPDAASDREITNVKTLIIKASDQLMSGILIDPVWGLPAYKKSKVKKPYLLCLEKTGYVEDKGERITELQYTASQIKKWGASGTKLLVYFNPEAQSCHKQLEVSRAAFEDSHKNNLPLFLEIVTYGNEEKGKSRSEWVLRSLEAFIKANIRPDVFKLEYPDNAASCRKITKMLGRTPWILLTRGETFDVFQKQLKDAIAAGAVGFLAGRALWQEIGDCQDIQSRLKFVKTIKKRFQALAKIALK